MRNTDPSQKFRQILAALAIERRWSKQQILEAYLNLVTYRGEMQGIGAASRVMFGKAPHGIDSAEAVVLAALIRAPNAHAAAIGRRPRRANRDRQPRAVADAPGERAMSSAQVRASKSSAQSRYSTARSRPPRDFRASRSRRISQSVCCATAV